MRRIKQFVTVIAASIPLLFAGLLPTATTYASGYKTPAESYPLIACGLWAGTNLNFNISNPSANCTSNPSAQPSATSQPTASTSQNSSPSGTASPAYVALGDSVAAGFGLPLFPNGNTIGRECGRSPKAYPYIVAKKLHSPIKNYACSGATAGDLVTYQHVNGPNPRPQLDNAFSHGTPKLITITAGANDAHWQYLIKECYVADCATSFNTTVADGFLYVLQAKLNVDMYSIENRSNGNPPQIILTGYYDPLSQQCSQIQHNITPQELHWIDAETGALNQTIRQVANNYDFVTFAPVDFSGHDLCSSNPWIQGLHDNAPFHPTAKGQQQIAHDVMAKIRQ
jgi:lysophospholipase L1-like esterase